MRGQTSSKTSSPASRDAAADGRQPDGLVFAQDFMPDGRKRRLISPTAQHGDDVGLRFGAGLRRFFDPARRGGFARNRIRELESSLPELSVWRIRGLEQDIEDPGPEDLRPAVSARKRGPGFPRAGRNS